MKVVKKQRNSWPFTSQVLANFLVLYRTWCKDMCGSDWPQTSVQTQCGGMEIPYMLVFRCSSKVKSNRLKELLESKIP